MLNNVAGKPIRAWNERETRYDVPQPPKGHVMRTVYDALQRPTQLCVKAGSDPEIVAERMIYGESQGDATNHRGRIYQHFDNAGVATNIAFDFKGNLLSSKRQLVRDYKNIPDWSGNPALETEVFSSSSRYDALNRPIQLVTPHSNLSNRKLNIIRPSYNEANLLERMDVWLGEAAEPTLLLDPQSANFHAVTNIDHDAKGQRTRIEYGNGAKTEYTYDPNTFRLVHLKTTRGGAVLQDLFYTYDPVGNITRIRDDAQQTIFFNNQVVLPHYDYTYDPIYRLIVASGREHIGQVGQPPETSWDDKFRVNLPHPSDGQAMRNYTEQYVYDAVGNFERLIHQAANGNWTRAYAYKEASLIELGKLSNRLSSTIVGQRTEPYTHDTHGNMTSMPHLMLMQWNYKDELSVTSRQATNDLLPNNVEPEKTFYVYDASGERVRKVTERQNGTRKNERIYLGGFEIYREFNGNGNDIKLERETLHVMDDKQRIALVETKTVTNSDDESPTQLIRYEFGNHLGSASLELDDKANVISYEEYYPYGSTSYQAVDKIIKAAAKRYRYTAKERDEETGFYYYGARYYVPWLGRWTTVEPQGLQDGTNLYQFVQSQPVNHQEIDGFGWRDFAKGAAKGFVVGLAVGLVVASLPIFGTAALVIGGAGILITAGSAYKTHSDYQSGKISEEQRDEQYGELAGGVVGGAVGGGTAKGLQGAAKGIVERAPSFLPELVPELVPAGPPVPPPRVPLPSTVSPTTVAVSPASGVVGSGVGGTAVAMATTGGGGSGGSGKSDKTEKEKPKETEPKDKNTGSSEDPAKATRPSPASDNYRGRYNASRAAEGKSRLPDDWDAHHKIPQEYRDHPDFKKFDFDAPENIQGVKGSRADVNVHQDITNQWADFRKANPNATGQQIKDFALKIDSMFQQHWWK